MNNRMSAPICQAGVEVTAAMDGKPFAASANCERNKWRLRPEIQIPEHDWHLAAETSPQSTRLRRPLSQAGHVWAEDAAARRVASSKVDVYAVGRLAGPSNTSLSSEA